MPAGRRRRRHYLAFADQFCRAGHCLALPTWNHLWFVAYLWVYTAALILFMALAPRLLRRAEAALARILAAAALLFLPPLAAFRLVLFPSFPPTNALLGDWYNHALYGCFFLVGYLAASSPSFRAASLRWRWAALLLDVLAYGSFMIWRVLPHAAGAQPPLALLLYGRVAYAAYQWFCTLAVLGFGARWLGRDGAIRRYLTEAIFPYYIIHQTAIVAAAFALRGAALPAPLEAALVLIATAASCALGFEIIRRAPWLRPLFGLKPRQAAGARLSASTPPQAFGV
ncbi:MAG TPA: acyltransferase family protein [Stellaceae bacterium]|nr:acyltransferase family protein [Stellaceae bacterium]